VLAGTFYYDRFHFAYLVGFYGRMMSNGWRMDLILFRRGSVKSSGGPMISNSLSKLGS
jgi:hypothetical protein